MGLSPYADPRGAGVRTLALETTETIGSVAAADDDNLLVEHQLDPSQRSAQSLAPAIRDVLQQAGWQPSDVRLVAVTIGPGSFTGLRVGVATAKVFAYAAGAEVLGIDTLEVIAAAAGPEVQDLWTAVDAQRGDVVVRAFHRAPSGWLEPAGPAALVPFDTWLTGLPPGSLVSGPALGKLSGVLPPGVAALDPKHWRPTAANVARLALRHYLAGRRDDLWALVPHYSRRPAAEEKRDGV
ncbi:MAG: tRNA (adenosine(37)-N6)-threonylcarbamoyltransferase complex dimerization subunit type 1 TsaB [Thermoguttaceae bacterium]|jgi:tRNA threonylcarbamoyladenosine biosynthesis protein TsaB